MARLPSSSAALARSPCATASRTRSCPCEDRCRPPQNSAGGRSFHSRPSRRSAQNSGVTTVGVGPADAACLVNSLVSTAGWLRLHCPRITVPSRSVAPIANRRSLPSECMHGSTSHSGGMSETREYRYTAASSDRRKPRAPLKKKLPTLPFTKSNLAPAVTTSWWKCARNGRMTSLTGAEMPSHRGSSPSSMGYHSRRACVLSVGCRRCARSAFTARCSGVLSAASRRQRLRMSPTAGPPSTRTTSAVEPPSSLTGRLCVTACVHPSICAATELNAVPPLNTTTRGWAGPRGAPGGGGAPAW
mmetsp:Transcript_5096/g.17774  ORF Transcript_5096/g.17774 Transcript_5096/m.17774 type:complete len:302 (+) Transcript_5096:1721-2626(+)